MNLRMNGRSTAPNVEKICSVSDAYAAPVGHSLAVVYPLLVFIPDEEFHSSAVVIKEHSDNVGQRQTDKKPRGKRLTDTHVSNVRPRTMKDTDPSEVF